MRNHDEQQRPFSHRNESLTQEQEALLTMAVSYCRIGRFEQGMILYEQLLSLPATTMTLYNIWTYYARDLLDMGQLELALVYCQRVYWYQKEHFCKHNDSDRDTLRRLENCLLMGQVTFDLGNMEGGVTIISTAWKISMSLLGPDDVMTGELLVELKQMKQVMTITDAHDGFYHAMVMDKKKSRAMGALVGLQKEQSLYNGFMARLLDYYHANSTFLVDLRPCQAVEQMDYDEAFHVKPDNIVWCKDTKVVLHSLSQVGDFNTKQGVVVAFAEGFYTILVGETKISVPPGNVMPMEMCLKGPLSIVRSDEEMLSLADQLTNTKRFSLLAIESIWTEEDGTKKASI